jgi:hypothetical protein
MKQPEQLTLEPLGVASPPAHGCLPSGPHLLCRHNMLPDPCTLLRGKSRFLRHLRPPFLSAGGQASRHVPFSIKSVLSLLHCLLPQIRFLCIQTALRQAPAPARASREEVFTLREAALLW